MLEYKKPSVIMRASWADLKKRALLEFLWKLAVLGRSDRI